MGKKVLTIKIEVDVGTEARRLSRAVIGRVKSVSVFKSKKVYDRKQGKRINFDVDWKKEQRMTKQNERSSKNSFFSTKKHSRAVFLGIIIGDQSRIGQYLYQYQIDLIPG